MKRFALAAITITIAGSLLVSGAAKKPVAPGSVVKIALPGDLDFGFKNAPDVQIVQINCLTCHSSAYVSTQPRLSHDQWTAEVTKMQHAYGAPIADSDVPKIVAYLTANYGKANP